MFDIFQAENEIKCSSTSSVIKTICPYLMKNVKEYINHPVGHGMLLYRSEAMKAAMRTVTLALPSLTETAPLALAAAEGVAEGMTAAAAVPLRALATSWNAVKLRAEV